MKKKILSAFLALCLAFGSAAALPQSSVTESTSITASAADAKKVSDYSYEITPLLAPFNEYFFVKTDNPDPWSFRFCDKSSVYGKDAYVALNADDFRETPYIYADIKYENKKTARVNGGYIFYGGSTDGGELVLQSKSQGRYSWEYTWEDTKVKVKTVALKDDVDYLVDTYSKKGAGFFDNMDAVQSGFSSICLYSGSYIRGKLTRKGKYWSLSNSPHKDQTFYIQSPYNRDDTQRLFATAIYPFRYDSLGFPSVMGAVSKKLNSKSTYKWDSNRHYIINVTYNGKTRSYGGAGSGEGQAITTDKIKQYYKFGSNQTAITMESTRKLLQEYASLKIPDDIPRKDALTWKSLCDKAGSGTWVKMTCLTSIFGGTSEGYTFLYKNNDGKSFWTEEFSDTGSSIYWGGDLGFFSDVWLDGRYINGWEAFEMGAKFSDHPTSSIALRNYTTPQVKYDTKYNYNYDEQKWEYEYSNITVTEKKKLARFYYDETQKVWKADYNSFDQGCATYDTIKTFVEEGKLDKKYLDMITLSLKQVKALNVDKNTYIAPESGKLFDGSAAPGTKFNNTKINSKNTTVTFKNESYTYTGSEINAEPTVKYGAKTLKKDKDYLLVYKNNTDVGTATVMIVGYGNYSGCFSKTFRITAKQIRYAGSDRADTAARISKAANAKTSDTVILATGFDFHDALAAVPLASAYNAPLLLADRDNLSAKTIAEIKRLKAKNVIVVATTTAKDNNGKDAAIRNNVYKQLKDLKVKVTKLEGKTYYATAKRVADQLKTKTKKNPTSVFITTDKNYADALSASPVAAILGAPILYVDPKANLNAATKNYLASIKKSVKNVYIVGGVNAVSANVEKAILSTLGKKKATRFAGSDRYETCIKINKAFAKALTGKSVCIAKGYNFPDALAGGVFAAKQKAPLFLADKLDKNATISKTQSAFLKSKNPNKLYIFGGETAVPKALVKTIAKACV